ncbi:prenyltransferase [Methanothermobacter wolfeii]|uniref:prenyltransferase n=1 Tax=Methanothermobacter wolfeii TaxID=145261 RepID=UPI0024B31F77|nr:prenyltransferase [Methanothermobacter wolfeii]MDI6702694.1 prenyltransferase [Methanothermobacter wolfeii]
MGQVAEVIKLGRFPFLGAGLILYAAGGLLAGVQTGQFSIERFIMGYAIVMPAHLSVSYSNDYYDFENDNPDAVTSYTGGSGVLQRHPELRGFARNFAVTLIMLSVSISVLYASVYGNAIVVLLAVLGNLLGWFYSAPPIKLSYRGLGEIATSLTGFIFPGMGYAVISGGLDASLLLFSIPLMLLQMVFIVNVEIPDLREDLEGGKKTLPVRIGVDGSRRIMVLSASAATLLFGLLEFSPRFAESINFLIMALLSLMVTVPCLHAFLSGSNTRDDIVRKSEIVMNSLVAFGILNTLYIISIMAGVIR